MLLGRLLPPLVGTSNMTKVDPQSLMGRQTKKGRPVEAAPNRLHADRVGVFQRSVDGRFRRLKWAIMAACLAVYYITPWLRWNRTLR